MTSYIDNTMITAFRKCPRYYYLRHVLHWSGTGIRLPLSFGLSWHDAMDVVWGLTNKTDKTPHQVWKVPMLAFNECWEKEGLVPFGELQPDDIDRYKMRHPGTAAEMLHHYIEQRWNFLKEIEVMEIEKPFAVPLSAHSADLIYIGRLDKVYRYQGKVQIGEHKTSSAYSKASGFRPLYISSFSPNSQVDGYLHAGHMLYGDEMSKVIVDAALVHKTEHAVFKMIPVERQTSMLSSWLGETLSWIDRIQHESALAEDQAGSPYLTAFPKNTGACWDFASQCTYADVCRFWPDPHKRECPDGCEVNKWEPYSVLGFEEAAKQGEQDD